MRLTDLLQSQPFTLLVSLPANSPDLASAAVAAGADAIKVHINVHHRASGVRFGSLAEERAQLEAILRIAGDRPVGLVAGGAPDLPMTELSEAVAMGFTAISMYAHHLPAAWLTVPGADFMAAPDHTYTDREIAGLSDLPVRVVEAGIIPPDGYGQPLTVRDLAQYRRVVGLVRQPVVVPSQRRLVPADLPALQSTGIRAVMIGAVVTGNHPDTLYAAAAQFREAVDRL